MQNTKNYGLKKPEATDFYNIEDFNSNMDIIDENMGKLKTPVNIGKASFDGSSNITLDSIMGRALTTSSGASNAGKYTKFARIDISRYAYYPFCCVFDVTSQGLCMQGQLYVYSRTVSSIADVEMRLKWIGIQNIDAQSVVVVKVSDGVFDLYYRPHLTYLITSFTMLNAISPSAITLYSTQEYVDSVTPALTSSLGGVVGNAHQATKDGKGNVIADFYAPKKDEVVFSGSASASIDEMEYLEVILDKDISTYEELHIHGYLICSDLGIINSEAIGSRFSAKVRVEEISNEPNNLDFTRFNISENMLGIVNSYVVYDSNAKLLDLQPRMIFANIDDGVAAFVSDRSATLYITKVTAR